MTLGIYKPCSPCRALSEHEAADPHASCMNSVTLAVFCLHTTDKENKLALWKVGWKSVQGF